MMLSEVVRGKQLFAELKAAIQAIDSKVPSYASEEQLRAAAELCLRQYGQALEELGRL